MADALYPGMVVAETYEVERLLGRGGMGEVWLARHLRLTGKQLAIKVLHTQGEVPADALARFKREGEIAARLEHPNIVQVLDFNNLPSGQPFIVMELLKGESLAARLHRGPLSPDEVSQVMRQVGSALHTAHQAGVVHRDLKPENIFLVPTGLADQVKVLDFGISKLNDGGTMQTTDSVLMGTPLYMSPEQALGHNRDVTAQSDVFSLGTITYECLTGVNPFAADNIAKVVFRIAYEPHTPLRQVAPQVPEAMEKAVERALKKDRAERTPEVTAFVLELTGQVLSDTGISRPLAPVQPTGVATPGSSLDEQMMADATVSPSQLAAKRPSVATPLGPGAVSQPSGVPQPTVTPSSPSRPPPVMFAIGATVVVAIFVATYVIASKLDNKGAEDPKAVVAFDAGAVVLGAPVDAGIPQPDSDAGASNAGLAAGGGPDAGAVVVKPVAKPAAVTPVPAVDQPVLREVEALVQAKRWTELWDRRLSLNNRFTSPEGRREFTVILVEAACQRGDLSVANQFMRQLDSAAAKSHARARCRRHREWDLGG